MILDLVSHDTPPLAGCHGFQVDAVDGPLGEVETPLFPPSSDAPDYLVVRVREEGRLFARFPVVPVALVAAVDLDEHRVELAASRRVIEALPERLPVAAS